MPLNVTPQNATPDQPRGPSKYQPQRTSPSVTGQTAPIPGVEEQAPVARTAPSEQEAETPEGGAPGEEGQQDPDLAWRLGVVAKQAKHARQLQADAKRMMAEARTAEERIAAREKAIQAEEAKREVWRRDPAALLRDHGYNAEGALQYLLNGEKLTPEQELAARLDQRLEETKRETQAELDRRLAEEARQREEQEAEDERRRAADLSQQEQVAVQELRADIGDIITADAQAFPILADKGERGLDAVFAQVNAISDEMYEKTGRRPPITTKMLERAAQDVEAAARAEVEKEAQKLGLVGTPMPRRPATLGNRAPVPAARQAAGEQRQETYAEKTARVRAMIEPMLRGGRAR